MFPFPLRHLYSKWFNTQFLYIISVTLDIVGVYWTEMARIITIVFIKLLLSAFMLISEFILLLLLKCGLDDG